MKSLNTILVLLLGLTDNIYGVSTAINLNASHDGLNPMISQTDATAAFNDTTVLGGWPPFYSTQYPQNLCNGTFGHDISSHQVPNPRDCAILHDQVGAKPGLWNITANPGRPASYILLISHGACALVAAPLDSSKDCLIGSQDAQDLLYDHVKYYADSSVSSTMICTNNATTHWAIIHT